jgi:hypothetical protein
MRTGGYFFLAAFLAAFLATFLAAFFFAGIDFTPNLG